MWEARIMSATRLLSATNVKRYHTVPIIGEQNIGHHSHRVCLILRHLLNGEVPVHLYEAAMFHDLAESVTGDVPAQTKWANSSLSKLLDEWEDEWHVINGTSISLCDDEQDLLSIADKLELVVFCTEQLMLGNKRMEIVRERGIMYVKEILETSGLGGAVRERVTELIEECTDEC